MFLIMVQLKLEWFHLGVLEFDREVGLEILEKIGVMPLPPYIKRTPRLEDNQRYQTVYARNPGAIASPTAGLHFTAGVNWRDKKIKPWK